ncbi:DNA-binding transcriptional regulator, LysR family [Acetitomaculum ruminis DSM 5522]|uniref:DNA-binding transcriptional regulator, LysR family n=1 Tax=Acetitomaculum ruminis DSM 5522 TaxID=1120918 RepID=A0A1I0YC41_9FIRM|nr:LysR family transcriptional regulator [Acetitomaculum ruminis]SFB10884.1 DNA-binding transcriptional regulator, LysR family [Acetitomaculum ruminis DSM 5522]
MTNTQIKCFLMLADCLNFSLAAQNMEISQPTLSKHIKLLEDELKLKLFDRNNRKVILTRDGEIMYEAFRSMAKTLKEAQYKCKNKNEPAKKLSVGICQGWSVDIIPGITKKFREHIKEVVRGTANEIVDLLYKEEIDLILIPEYLVGSPKLEKMEKYLFSNTKANIYISRYKDVDNKSIEEIVSGEDLFIPEYKDDDMFCIFADDIIARNSLMPKSFKFVDSLNTMLNSVRFGLGCAIFFEVGYNSVEEEIIPLPLEKSNMEIYAAGRKKIIDIFKNLEV